MELLINFPASLELTELSSSPPNKPVTSSILDCAYSWTFRAAKWRHKNNVQHSAKYKSAEQTELQATTLSFKPLKQWGWGNKINPKMQNLFI